MAEYNRESGVGQDKTKEQRGMPKRKRQRYISTATKRGNRCQSMQRACVLDIYCVKATMRGCIVTSKLCKPLTTRHMQQSFQEKRVQN